MIEKKKIKLLTLNDVLEKGEDISYIQRWLTTVGLYDVNDWEKKHSPDYSSLGYDSLKKNISNLRNVNIPDWLKITGSSAITLKGGKVFAPPALAYKFEEWIIEMREKEGKMKGGDSFGDALGKIGKAGKPK